MTSSPISAALVTRCQCCGSASLKSVLFLGYIQPVNKMPEVGRRPAEQEAYPAEVLICEDCNLVQLGLVVDAAILFPPDYPYTSGTTKLLHTNFADLAEECSKLLGLTAESLIVDVGSNDGTLLSKFQTAGYRVLGVEPTEAGKLAQAAGVPTEISFFNSAIVSKVLAENGSASVVTCANCFAHMDNVHEIVRQVIRLLSDDGVFVSESHYLSSLIADLQYDTVYHEHLRYYSITSLAAIFAQHGLEIIHTRRIPSHGGSIRVYASKLGVREVSSSVGEMLAEEAALGSWTAQLDVFRGRVTASKLKLYATLADLKRQGKRVVGIGAPSRASTLIAYVGLDADICEAVGEISGSRKIGRYMPGTLIPVVDESDLLATSPDVALLFSWHIADELMPKLRAKGFAGQFLIPLPEPRLV